MCCLSGMISDKFAFYHTGLSPYELQGKKLKDYLIHLFTLKVTIEETG